MNQAQSLLETLTLQGIDLWVDGEQLRYRGPKAVLTPERLGQLKQHKTDLLHYLATTTYRAAHEQQSAWAAYQAASEKATQHVAFAAHLHGAINMVAFQRAWQTLVNRHDTLRTTYAHEQQAAASAESNDTDGPNSTLFATVYGVQRFTVRQIDAQGWHEQELQTQLAVYQARPFDLTQGPLLRVTLFARAKNQQILLVSAPRIALDEPSLARLLNEFGKLYSAAQNGVTMTRPSSVATPAVYAAWQAAQLQLADSSPDRYKPPTFIDEELVLNLPVDYSRHAQQKGSIAQESFQLVPDLVLQLNKLATTTETTLGTLLLAAFQVLLHRYTSQNAFLVGITIGPRHHPEFTDLMGGFTTSVGLRTDIAASDGESMTFTELLTRTHRQMKVAQTQRAEVSAGSWQVAFAMQHSSDAWMAGESVAWGELEVTPFALADTPDSLELKLELVDVEGGITGTFHYRTDLFAPESIDRMVGHYRTLLNAIATDPNQSIATIPWLTVAERQQILIEWNDTATDYPKDKCIHHLFEEQVERTPEAIAVVFGEQQLTYQELNQRANQLAHYLQSLGVAPERLVGICMERSIEMVVGLLAILKAGGAYVPLDPAYPQERLAFMLADTQPPVLLTQQRSAHLFKEISTTVVLFDTEWETIVSHPSINLNIELVSTSPAYIIYTSGSTGIPKGVTIPHRAINRLLFNTNYIDILAKDRIGQASNASFDAATFEIWGALAHGATLIGIPREITLVPQDFAANLREQEITVLFLTTALFNQVVRAMPDAFATLRYLLFGGEAVDPTTVRTVLQQGGPTHLLHVYGPTESTTYSTWHPVQTVPAEALTVPIGGAISNTQLYVLDSQLQPVPIGIPGELYIGGDGLALEYHNRPELTAERFIPNPYGEGRIYKTGDLVRWLPDGAIEFLGRIDNQVKLRGFRIELGEVEAVLTRHLTVQDALVMLREDTVLDKRLVAYVVVRGEERVTGTQNAEILRAYLREKLPNYMVPSAFILLDALPLTPNGKVDRKALPTPEEVAELSTTEIVQPSNPIEAIMANIWCDVMNRTQVGIHDNFMDIGGHSLQATQVIDKIRRIFQVQFPLSRFFEASTVAELAQLLIKYESKPGQMAKLARLQQRLNKLTK